MSRCIGETPLHLAASTNKTDCITALVRYGADVNAVEDNQATPVLLAAYHGHTECIEALHNAKADLNRGSTVGVNDVSYAGLMPPISIAALVGKHAAVLTLARLGAYVGLTGYWSPLFVAVGNENPAMIDCIRSLVKDYNADVNEVRDLDGATALIVAAQVENIPVIALLHELGANLNGQEGSAVTPLIAAVMLDKTKAIQALVDLGADVNGENCNGQTALCHAAGRQD